MRQQRSRRRFGIALMVGIGLLYSPAGWLRNGLGQEVEPTVVTLNNGLTVIMLVRHEQPTVAGGVFYNVGGADDPRGKSGIAHMFEHMLFKGSKIIGTSDYEAERPLIAEQDRLRDKMIAEMQKMRIRKRRGQIDDVLDPAQWTSAYTEMKKRYDELVEEQRAYIKNNELFNLYTTNGGARLNAGTMEDATFYFVVLPANKLELLFWIESDRMANGIMREFYVERDNVREERRLRTESTPTGMLDERFNSMFWQSHPYGVPVIGWPSEVESITRDDVRDFYKVYYAPNNACLVLVGDFNTESAMTLAKRYFRRIPRGEKVPPPVITEEPPPIAERRFYGEAETNPRVMIRFHTAAIGHADEAALDVLSELLSGKTGRLYKRLVTQEEAVMGGGRGGPRAAHQARKYAGYFEISAIVKEGHQPEEVEQLILEEIDKLREGEITDYELAKVKNQVLASSVQRLRSNMGLLFQLGLYETWIGWDYINEAPKRMLAVDADEVRRAVNKYFDPATRTVAIYRTKAPDADAEEKSEEDAELTALLANLPEEAGVHMAATIERINSSEDIDRLRRMRDSMGARMPSEDDPEAQAAFGRYMLKQIEKRVAQLESTQKESE